LKALTHYKSAAAIQPIGHHGRTTAGNARLRQSVRITRLFDGIVIGRDVIRR
jgi:hypothetical protein